MQYFPPIIELLIERAGTGLGRDADGVQKTKSTPHPVSTPHMRGFSMIEVMVATAVFSLGLGGLSLMMQTAVHGTIEARNQTAAHLHASSLAELIALNPSSLGHYMNPGSTISGYCTGPEACSGQEWAAANLAVWQSRLEQNLADATAVVCRDSSADDGSPDNAACDGSGPAVVKVLWTDAHHSNEEDGGVRRVVLTVAEQAGG